VAPVVLIINYELEKRLCICNEDMLVNEAYRDAHNMVKALVDSKQATRNKQAKRYQRFSENHYPVLYLYKLYLEHALTGTGQCLRMDGILCTRFSKHPLEDATNQLIRETQLLFIDDPNMKKPLIIVLCKHKSNTCLSCFSSC